ncbi:uncharacterized protein PHACADRAFT_201696 [Phanerochaete carnosa HHB-10118-sp]|uniref:Fungal-type protein kinase domain-containing protein n=1 Tax=Phanerochaete carnosa (strain HHB-10118-sp) TaxID=650164 RepID=K5UIT5_PHACS|nr:uncharacterized protein PHACADRAFT_201696 [Phanerochaete carnosa HHB-10118-sp]EKM49436.1 hypothetical protein PHACADRAFT_201696 [Phanerochaete carnosa HHB-10118-sp]
MELHLTPEISTELGPGDLDDDGLVPVLPPFSDHNELLESDPARRSQIETLERDGLIYFQKYSGVIHNEKGKVDPCSQNTERNCGPPRPLILPNKNLFKGEAYEEQINAIMDLQYVLLTMKQFRKNFVPGSCLTAAQRARIVSIEPLRSAVPRPAANREKIKAVEQAVVAKPGTPLDGTPAVGSSRMGGGRTEESGSAAAPADIRDSPHEDDDDSVSHVGDALGEEFGGGGSVQKGKTLAVTDSPKPKPGRRAEGPMYLIIHRTFNSVLSMTSTKARFYVTANHCESGAFDSKPDIALYPGDDDPEAQNAYLLQHSDLKKNPDAARCAWAYMIAPVEVKADDTEAGFSFKPRSQPRANKRQKVTNTRGAGETHEEPQAKAGPGKWDGRRTTSQAVVIIPQKAKTAAGVRQPSRPLTRASAKSETYGRQNLQPVDADSAAPAAAPLEEAVEMPPPAAAQEEKIIPRSAAGDFHNSDKGNKARAQHAKYAAQIMHRQHRLHVISFYISGEWVRAFRWDQAGCVMTDAVNLVDDPDDFYDLLYCLGNIPDKWSGYDETVTKASEEDIQLLRSYTSRNVDLMRARSDMLDNTRFYPIYKVTCPAVHFTKPKERDNIKPKEDKKGPSERAFLISKLIAGHGVPVGRCTRGYIAFDLWKKDFCFLKDQWRSSVRRSELDVYTRLHKNGVRCIATPIAGGDVCGMLRSPQYTKTQRYLAPPSKQPALMRIHTRIVVEEVGRPLETYAGTVQLFEACIYALIAHMEAWNKANILHRDVSANNIMINVRDNEAFLNDWDLCKYKEDFGNRAREKAGVSGTWPYLSALTLTHPTKPPEVADDLESFIYVILIMAYRFHQHFCSSRLDGMERTPKNIRGANYANKGLAEEVRSIFYQQLRGADGRYTGGRQKLLLIENGKPPIILRNEDSILARFLSDAYALLQEHYRAVDFEALKPHYVKPPFDPNETQQFGHRAVSSIVRKFSVNLDGDDGEPLPAVRAREQEQRPQAAEVAKPRRVLDSHKVLLKLFDKMVTEAGDGANAYGKDDYIFDQFLGLGDVVVQGTSDTGQQRTTSSSFKRTNTS